MNGSKDESGKNARTAPGPIAQKFIRSLAKYTKQKVVNLHDWKAAKSYHEKIAQFHQEKDLSHLDPVHAVYMDMQHHIADFIEMFS